MLAWLTPTPTPASVSQWAVQSASSSGLQLVAQSTSASGSLLVAVPAPLLVGWPIPANIYTSAVQPTPGWSSQLAA